MSHREKLDGALDILLPELINAGRDDQPYAEINKIRRAIYGQIRMALDAERDAATAKRKSLDVLREEMREKGCEPSWEDQVPWCRIYCPSSLRHGLECRLGGWDLTDRSGEDRAAQPACYPMIEAMTRALQEET